LSGAIFQRFWPPPDETAEPGGAPTEDSTEGSTPGPADEIEMRTAAAVLLATLGDEDTARRVRPLLEEARRGASGRRQVDLDLALTAVYGQLEAWAELRSTADRLLEAEPDSAIGFTVAAEAYARLDDLEGLRRIAHRRLERKPDDLDARTALYQAAAMEGDLETALSALEKALGEPSAPSILFNNAAWDALILGRADDQALRWAQEAAERSSYQDRATLHTLASIYAEMDRPEEAYRVLLQGMEVTSEPPESADWYVLGRMAERYGLPEAARRYYERVERPEETNRLPESVWTLARNRLRAMSEGADVDATEEAVVGNLDAPGHRGPTGREPR
jgi:tetratricopeptide (TPR) repeat protein